MAKNNYFKFKQFTVFQNKAAMKVGTDGILLGAWTDVSGVKTILDVGTGTGLIALMLAQRSVAKITAIEIEEDAAREAEFNIAQSSWKDRIMVSHATFQQILKGTHKFDLVVSNPPYFQHSIKSVNKKRSLARHNDSLPFSILIKGCADLLEESGRCTFIVPVEGAAEMMFLAEANGIQILRKTDVKPTKLKSVNRVLLEFGKKEAVVVNDCLTIYNNDALYTKEFKNLTKDFYLNF